MTLSSLRKPIDLSQTTGMLSADRVAAFQAYMTAAIAAQMPTYSVGTNTSLSSGALPTVTTSGSTASNIVLNFGIPAGAAGTNATTTSAATASTAGLMSTDMFTKLNGLGGATTSASGTVKKAAMLTAPAASTLTGSTGGTVSTVLSTVAGAVYATDAATLKSNMASIMDAQNKTNARLEDLIAKSQTAGILT